MKITLKVANKLSKTLMEIADELPISSIESVEITEDMNMDSIERIIDKRQKQFENYILEYSALYKAAYDIRILIGKFNFELGISDLLTQDAYLASLQSKIRQINVGFNKPTTASSVYNQFQNSKLRYGILTNKFDVCLDSYVCRDHLASIKKKRSLLFDKINNINISSEIELPETISDLTKNYDLDDVFEDE